jgi:hypothetical protein
MGFVGAFSLGVELDRYDEEFLSFVSDEVALSGAIFWQIEEYHPRGLAESTHDTYGRHFLEPWTRILDLSLSDEELMRAMHEK